MRLDPQGLKATSAAKSSTITTKTWVDVMPVAGALKELPVWAAEDLPFTNTPFLRAGARITATFYLGVKR